MTGQLGFLRETAAAAVRVHRDGSIRSSNSAPQVQQQELTRIFTSLSSSGYIIGPVLCAILLGMMILARYSRICYVLGYSSRLARLQTSPMKFGKTGALYTGRNVRNRTRGSTSHASIITYTTRCDGGPGRCSRVPTSGNRDAVFACPFPNPVTSAVTTVCSSCPCSQSYFWFGRSSLPSG